MRKIIRCSLVSLLLVMFASCVDEYDYYDIKIVNNSTQDIFVFSTDLASNTIGFGRVTIIPKGECYEQSLGVYKPGRNKAYVSFIFSDRVIDINTDIPNQEPTDSEACKLVCYKYTPCELLQMNYTIIFNGFENEQVY